MRVVTVGGGRAMSGGRGKWRRVKIGSGEASESPSKYQAAGADILHSHVLML